MRQIIIRRASSLIAIRPLGAGQFSVTVTIPGQGYQSTVQWDVSYPRQLVRDARRQGYGVTIEFGSRVEL